MEEQMTEERAEGEEATDTIKCQICEESVHIIQSHLKDSHPDMTIEEYKTRYPDAPVFSERAKEIIIRKKKQKAESAKPAESTENTAIAALATGGACVKEKAPFHEVFDLGPVPAAMTRVGAKPINIDVFKGHGLEDRNYLPEVDDDYVFNIELTKKVIIALTMNVPAYLWGVHGTGKTSMFEQVCARTGRPFSRVQHTVNMQESDVIGQWTVKNGATEFQLGPLPIAMINGWAYCADEYDTAMPNVVTVYQSVMEGKPLIIKDAPPHLAKIIPHPDFRFCATGNTNGSGDETGMYQGTLIQNAANYSRFGMTERVNYMDKEIEIAIIQAKVACNKKHATALVNFANDIRESYINGTISLPISPRELITAGRIGMAMSGDWAEGLRLAYVNRLSNIDFQTVGQVLQRKFGDKS